MFKSFKYLAAPFTTLAIAAAVAGCPNNTTPPTPSTNPKTPKPSASASSPTTAPTSTTGATTGPTATPSSNATSLPSGTPSSSSTPSSTPSGSANPSATPSAGTTPTPTPTATATTTTGTGSYKQVERLGRPAINEGLIRDNDLLNLWNSVDPSVDATTAAKPIADHATVTLQALGNTTEQTQALFTQLLPDVMRIDTTRTSGYASAFGTSALDNLSPTKKIPIGGRMITDDVVDITLFLIVPTATANAVPNLRSDAVAYKGVHKDVLTEFPYLAAPN